MTTSTYAEPALYRENPPSRNANPAASEATLDFGRFRVLLRQRQLLADGVAIELGTRALNLLLVLLEADGSRHERRAAAPCVARHRCRGRELEGSDLCVTQGSWRGP